MSGHEYPENVVVDWCIEAKITGAGKAQKFMVEGNAETAVADMVAWLESRDEPNTGTPKTPRIEVVAELTSNQLPDWLHRLTTFTAGMPFEAAIKYTVDAVRQFGEVENWGGSR